MRTLAPRHSSTIVAVACATLLSTFACTISAEAATVPAKPVRRVPSERFKPVNQRELPLSRQIENRLKKAVFNGKKGISVFAFQKGRGISKPSLWDRTDWASSDITYAKDSGNDGLVITRIDVGNGRLHLPDGTTAVIFDPVGYAAPVPVKVAMPKPNKLLALFKFKAKGGQTDMGDAMMLTAHTSVFELREPLAIRTVDNDTLLETVRMSMPRRKPSFREAIAYASGEGWREMDYTQNDETHMTVFDNVAYDRMDFGNLTWGAGMQTLGIPLWIALAGAHYNSLRAHNAFDSMADQKAIVTGYRWAAKHRVRDTLYPDEAPSAATK